MKWLTEGRGLTLETKDFDFEIIDPINPLFILEPYEEEFQKHEGGGHDQKTHGNWATGGEISNWNPNDPVPESPRNAGGMTEKIWDNWEHGPDGNQYVELYRQYAAEALGLQVPKSDMAPGGSENYLTQRGFGGSSTETAKGHAVSILKAIANGSPTQPALYRGVTESRNDPNSTALMQQLSNLKTGDTIDMPLVSTTRSLGVASWYAADRIIRPESGISPIIMKIQPGARGVSIAPDKSYYPSDHEVITSGKFEVVSINQVKAPYWKRGIFEPRKIEFRPEFGGTDYAVVTYSSKKYTSAEAKSIWETVSAGKIQSLATPKFKFTDDRRASGKRQVYSSWELQTPANFTIVEVKMIEPHVVRRADSKDYGLTFDALFNNIPFFREEDVTKHQEHDQKTHGSWADGVASPEAGSADQEAMYKYIYEEKGFVPLENPPLKEGEKPEKYQSDYDLVRHWEDINNERISDGLEPIDFYAIEQSPVMTKWEFKALRSYLGSGAVEHINPWLRSTRAIYPEEKNVTTLKIASLDSLISKVPEVRSETPLFRMFNKNVVEKMEIGQVFKDRGFLSTSFADVTDPKNIKLRNEMNFMQPTGVIGRIVPNGHYSGLSVNHVQQDMFYKHEKEFLMPRGSEFRYLGLGKTPSGETVMDFERLSG